MAQEAIAFAAMAKEVTGVTVSKKILYAPKVKVPKTGIKNRVKAAWNDIGETRMGAPFTSAITAGLLGFAGGLATNAIAQGALMGAGRQDDFNVDAMLLHGGVGALAGGANKFLVRGGAKVLNDNTDKVDTRKFEMWRLASATAVSISANLAWNGLSDDEATAASYGLMQQKLMMNATYMGAYRSGRG